MPQTKVGTGIAKAPKNGGGQEEETEEKEMIEIRQ